MEQLDSRLKAELSFPDGSWLQLLAVEGLTLVPHAQQQALAARSAVRGSDTRVSPPFFMVCKKRSIPFTQYVAEDTLRNFACLPQLLGEAAHHTELERCLLTSQWGNKTLSALAGCLWYFISSVNLTTCTKTQLANLKRKNKQPNKPK